MRSADHAVLMVAKQALNVLCATGHLALPSGRRGVAESLGALANAVQRLVAVLVGGARGVLRGLTHPLVRRVDGHLDRLLAGGRRSRLGGHQTLERVEEAEVALRAH